MHTKFLAAVFAVVFSVAAAAQMPDRPIARPKITGISHLAAYTSDPAATERYYVGIIGAVKLPDPENKLGVRYAISEKQFVEVLPLPANSGINRLDHVAFNTGGRRGTAQVSGRQGVEDSRESGEGRRRQSLVRGARSRGQQGGVCATRPPAQSCLCARRHRPPHYPCGHSGAQPGGGRHVLSRLAGLSPLLVRRRKGRHAELGEPANPGQPRLAGIHAHQGAGRLRNSAEPVAARFGRAGSPFDRRRVGGMRPSRRWQTATA